MNDPHVVALIYEVEHGASVEYSQALLTCYDKGSFWISAEHKKLRFELKEHYATEREAREIVDPFTRAWEFDAALKERPGYFRIVYWHAEIVDRSPTPGIIEVSPPPVRWEFRVSQPTVTLVKPSYPAPPPSLNLDPDNPDVQTMYVRYANFSEGKEPLPGLAYFCYTMLTYRFSGQKNQRRQSAAATFNISASVLKTVNRLASNKGGRSASRKAEGVVSELSPEEISYLEAAVKIMIRRVAEVAFSGMAPAHQITQIDLPILSP